MSASAEPGDAIGAAITIVNHVTGEYNSNLRNLYIDDDVRQEEVIAVDEDSLGELMLRDQTKVALGPGARLRLDRFIYDPNKARRESANVPLPADTAVREIGKKMKCSQCGSSSSGNEAWALSGGVVAMWARLDKPMTQVVVGDGAG